MEYVGVDPDAREIDYLEETCVCSHARADGGIALDYDSINRRVKRKDGSQVGFARQRINRRIFQTEYQQVAAGGGERRFRSIYGVLGRRFCDFEIMFGGPQIFPGDDGLFIEQFGAVVGGLGQLDLGDR